MSQYDYGEIICTAIDEIVTTRLQGIECDITKLCTVVDDSYSYEGKYVVSDGGARFEAYSSDSSFKKGNSVLVTIPNGNFNLQKTITGRVAATDSTPFKYTSPLSTMLKIEENLLNENYPETGLLINKNNSSTAKKHLEIAMFDKDLNKYEGFTRLGVSADFKCLLNGQDVVSGSYGLKILINADVLVKPGEVDTTTGVIELTFNSDDMIGNPYHFDDYFTQEKVFDISNISNIKSIEIYLYQNGQFKNSDGIFIPWSYKETIGDTQSIALLRDNLFVNNIKLYFGYELSKYTGETLEIYSTNPTMTYHYSKSDEENQKSMNLRWIHQNKDSSITMLDTNDFNKDEYKNYEIHWFKYNYGYEHINQYAGANWEEITPENSIHSLNCFFNPDIKKQNEQIKVVGLIKELVDFNIPINNFNETTEDYIFYYNDNNKTQWFKLQVTNHEQKDFIYKLIGINNEYLLDIKYNDQNQEYHYYINIDNVEQEVYLKTNIIFPIQLKQYNFKIKDKNNHYLIFLDKDINIKIKKDNIDYQVHCQLIKNDNENLINQYYYLANENTKVDLILVADVLSENLTTELANIKINNFVSINDYYTAINNVYEKYYGIIPEPEYSVIAHFSNLLIFNNEEKVVDDLTYRAATALSIRCVDNSEGNYFIYDQNGKIINEGLGNGNIKYFEAQYNGQPLNNNSEIELGKYDYIKWYLPFDNDNNNFGYSKPLHGTHTMLIKSPQLWDYADGIYKNDINNQYLDTILNIDGVDYIGIQRNTFFNEETGKYEIEAQQPYMIKNYWTVQDSNNIVKCEMCIKGTIYKTIEDLKFGKAGSNGTNTTLVLDMMNGQNALVVNDDKEKELQIRAILYDINGNIIDLPKNNGIVDIHWSWYSKNENNYILPILNQENEYDGKQIITLTCNTDIVPEDNYFILKAECGSSPKLEAYLPIPIKINNISKIEGAREVLYDYQGNASYYSDAYVLYNKDFDEIMPENLEWILNNSKQNIYEKTMLNYLPTLKAITRGNNNNYKALSASTFFAKDVDNQTCVYCIYDNQIVWSQPILIMQNHYNFDVLNQWDGSLTLDENNGIILSTMLGAGRKDDQNQFSGVLIGDIQDGTNLDSSDSHTGVYGLHNGQLSYALKDDGTATFGKAGHGQIKIDGNTGKIYSPNYYQRDLNNNITIGSGMLIDLDDGEIKIQGIKTENDKYSPQILISPNSPYLEVISSNATPLISINNNNYYLQSDKYNYSDYGMKISLNTGTINIDGTGGSLILSGDESQPFFKVVDSTKQNILIELSTEKYILQSSNYNGLDYQFDTTKTYYIYQDENNDYYGVLPDKSKVYKAVKDNNNYIVNLNAEKKYESGQKIIDTGMKDEDDKPIKITVTYTADEARIEEINSWEILTTTSFPKGLNIDLNNGFIDGYGLYLRGTKLINGKPDKKSTFILDSQAIDTPFKIGSKFKVNWDGTLTCNKINYLGTKTNDTGKVININDYFYISKNASGGSGSSRGYFGGTSAYASGAASAASAKLAEDASCIKSAMKGSTDKGFFCIYDGNGYIRSSSGIGMGTIKTMQENILALQTQVTDLLRRIAILGG